MAVVVETSQKVEVAYLEVWATCDEEDFTKQPFSREDSVRLPIYANEEFSIGRAPDWQHGIPQLSEPIVSNQHLKFHSIVYDVHDTNWGVPPMVYAEDRSTNGTYLVRGDECSCFFPQNDGRRKCRQRVNELVPKECSYPPGKLMGSEMGVTLLEENDCFWITPRLILNYHVSKRFSIPPYPLKSEQDDLKYFEKHYKVTGRRLGLGGHGAVYVAIHRKSQRQIACKVLDLTSLDVERAFREFRILNDLDHPNIIRLEKVYHSVTRVYIFEELVTAGDLFSYVEKRGAGQIHRTEVAVILRQILKGVEYLHDRNIVHRDLKPDNVLLASTKQGARIIITDFGSARYMDPETQDPMGSAAKRMSSTVGTYEYAAPEIYRQNATLPRDSGYSSAVDMWSIGCIAATLLSGDAIFSDRLHPEYNYNPAKVTVSLAAACDLTVLDTGHVWRKVHSRPKDFIRRLLVLDEMERMTVKQALSHPWFTHNGHNAEYEAEYQRAIRYWKPKGKAFRVIERIHPKPSKTVSVNRSPYFPMRQHKYRTVPMVNIVADQVGSPGLSTILEEPEEQGASPLCSSTHNSVRSETSPSVDGDMVQHSMKQLTLSDPDITQDADQDEAMDQSIDSHIGFMQSESEEQDTVLTDAPSGHRSSSPYEGLEDADMFEAMDLVPDSQPMPKRRRLNETPD